LEDFGVFAINTGMQDQDACGVGFKFNSDSSGPAQLLAVI